MKSVFEYEDYRDFLSAYIKGQSKGAKLRLSAVLDCQPGYLTQILSGSANLSLEQTERLTSHLGLDATATQYLLTLVSLERAGTAGLKRHLTSELNRMRGEALVLKRRFKPDKVLSIEDQATFYSSWHYGALHVCVSIPTCETEEGISRYFDLPLKRVNEVLQFLVRVGLVKRSDSGKLMIGSTQVYIGSDSPLVSKHHTNWRIRAVEAMDRYKGKHLHYSSVISVSEADVTRIREYMVQTIEKIRNVVRDSNDEKCFSYCLDLFEVGKK